VSVLSTFDLEALSEGVDIECKRASGRDGQGECPKSVFESYVAMANTQGGTILLGVNEPVSGQFAVTGIADPAKVRKSLWDGLNNPQRVNKNLLIDQCVDVVTVDGLSVVRIKVPRASRRDQPIYLGLNPLKGTYRRNYEGDYLCDEVTVRRMLAEQVEDSRDARLMEGYGFDDLEIETLRRYRNQFKSTKPDHPWLELDDQEFLRSLGGWAKDRQTGVVGLTLAGLLMFGKQPSILAAVPNYIVDYQEGSRASDESRWLDRITTDGTWSGNLYDFYRRVIQKLFVDLKVPFKLLGIDRVDETPVHEALREALVNTLIHADYTGRVSILVVKRPDMFVFRNPGLMRLPLVEVKKGGISDCRNRNLQKMFQLIGQGEQAGSGIPKIYRNWEKQQWQLPELKEELELEVTNLSLRMVSLLPQETFEEMDVRFGERFRELPHEQQLALVTVANEGQVNHARLTEMTSAHSRDLTLALAALVKEGFLTSSGAARRTVYFFPGEPPCAPDELSYLDVSLGQTDRLEGQMDLPFSGVSVKSDDLVENSDHLSESSDHLSESSDHLSEGSDHLERLRRLTAPLRGRKKVAKALMQSVICDLCREGFLTQKQLSELLHRSPHTLRNSYLNQMVKDSQLVLKYPHKLNHPQQAYHTLRI
jgi:ATP-dependent DNA helicase RecG